MWSEPETLRSNVVGERVNSVDMRSIIEGVRRKIETENKTNKKDNQTTKHNICQKTIYYVFPESKFR